MSKAKLSSYRLIIAPHSDDALLAIGGTILEKKRFKVLNVFSTCAWSAIHGLNDPQKITLINNQEEGLAVKKAGAQLEFLKIKEALLRGYSHWNNPVNYQKDRKLKEQITLRLVENLKTIKEVYFPLAIGNHVDHQFIFDIFLELAKDSCLKNKTVFLFEDLPYAIFAGLKQRIERVKKIVRIEQVLIDITSAIDKKCSLLSIYKSQLTPRDIQDVRKYAQSIGSTGKYYERIWQVKSEY